jgi:signal transduction histidine kinase/CheY-like chemotaxis protein
MSLAVRKSISAKIDDISPQGFYLDLPNSEEAFLPYLELGWTEKERQANRKKYHRGDYIDVVKHQKGQKFWQGILVSYRRVEFDVWDNISEKDLGKEMVIHVESVNPKRAYGRVQFRAGKDREVELEVYVIFQELDDYMKSFAIEDWKKYSWIVPGDVLKGILKNIDRDEELLELSIAGYLGKVQDRPDDILNEYKIVLETEQGDQLWPGEKEHTSQEIPWPREINRIAVIDDEDKYRKIIVGLLKKAKYEVNDFKNATEFWSSADEVDKYQMVIIDINLGEEKHEGIDLAQKLRDQYPHKKIVLISGEGPLNESKRQRGQGVLINGYGDKWFTALDFRRFLAEIAKALPRPFDEFFPPSPDKIDAGLEIQERKKLVRQGELEVGETLKKLVNYCPGSTAVIFALQRDTGECRVEAKEIGSLTPNEKFTQQLRYSPVKDCILENDEIKTGDAQKGENIGRHKWLLRFFAHRFETHGQWDEYEGSYHSCLGMGLQQGEADWGRALFWVHPDKNQFSEIHFSLLKWAGDLAHSCSTVTRLREAVRQEKVFSLGGRLAAQLGHELAGQLSGTEIKLHNYLEDPKDERGTLEQCLTILEDAKTAVGKSLAIGKAFRRLAQKDRVEQVSLTEIINKAKDTVEAFSPFVKILPINGGGLMTKEFIVKADPITLELVFFNIFLNAAQQIELFIRKTGKILVSVQDYQRGQESWGMIRIIDNGPGIHPRDFEAIFREGVTTKEEGTGLGLHICRDLVKQMGGSIKVNSSILLASTCFEVNLPLVQIRKIK